MWLAETWTNEMLNATNIFISSLTGFRLTEAKEILETSEEYDGLNWKDKIKKFI